MTKQQKRKDWLEFLAKLKALPPEKQTKGARWAIAYEESGEKVKIDMRAVLK